mmetsp:Transcript_12953/g.30900  ORF Transcript_12953/g.30900 Transcript_12953/m.30900 type:complete len:121 (-) Transcript_12953:1717-2079(-)
MDNEKDEKARSGQARSATWRRLPPKDFPPFNKHHIEWVKEPRRARLHEVTLIRRPHPRRAAHDRVFEDTRGAEVAAFGNIQVAVGIEGQSLWASEGSSGVSVDDGAFRCAGPAVKMENFG